MPHSAVTRTILYPYDLYRPWSRYELWLHTRRLRLPCAFSQLMFSAAHSKHRRGMVQRACAFESIQEPCFPLVANRVERIESVASGAVRIERVWRCKWSACPSLDAMHKTMLRVLYQAV